MDYSSTYRIKMGRSTIVLTPQRSIFSALRGSVTKSVSRAFNQSVVAQSSPPPPPSSSTSLTYTLIPGAIVTDAAATKVKDQNKSISIEHSGIGTDDAYLSSSASPSSSTTTPATTSSRGHLASSIDASTASGVPASSANAPGRTSVGSDGSEGTRVQPVRTFLSDIDLMTLMASYNDVEYNSNSWSNNSSSKQEQVSNSGRISLSIDAPNSATCSYNSNVSAAGILNANCNNISYSSSILNGSSPRHSSFNSSELHNVSLAASDSTLTCNSERGVQSNQGNINMANFSRADFNISILNIINDSDFDAILGLPPQTDSDDRNSNICSGEIDSRVEGEGEDNGVGNGTARGNRPYSGSSVGSSRRRSSSSSWIDISSGKVAVYDEGIAFIYFYFTLLHFYLRHLRILLAYP